MKATIKEHRVNLEAETEEEQVILGDIAMWGVADIGYSSVINDERVPNIVIFTRRETP